MLATLPILTRPTPGTPFLVYISVSDDAINATIVQEKEGSQYPVYFTSKVLQGSERRYQKIEKAALALIVTLRRLGPYFQGYHIVVRTNLPLRQVLRKSDLARRMVGWNVQLFEFDISFEKRGHIKAQALTDFITELTPIGHPSNEASNQAKSRASVILEGLEGVLIEESLRFEFKASNNQDKYEALLVEMRLAKELDAQILTTKSDSKLVTSQVNGEY
ncbi:Retrovirus-related Pol polyprotein from transposon 17.6, partial [Mucuna pruriens]